MYACIFVYAVYFSCLTNQPNHFITLLCPTLTNRTTPQVMTLNPMCEYVETAQGVPLTVTGVAQCKIMNEDELLTTACEQFLGKSVREIKVTVLQTLEGHLRAILGKFIITLVSDIGCLLLNSQLFSTLSDCGPRPLGKLHE